MYYTKIIILCEICNEFIYHLLTYIIRITNLFFTSNYHEIIYLNVEYFICKLILFYYP